MADRAFGVLFAAILCLAALAVNASRTEQQAERVHSQQRAYKAVGNQESAEKVAPSAKPAPSLRRDDKTEGKDAEENGTEFWPPFFGYRFKITDSLLVLFTGLLAWSTWELQRSTSGLQRAADEQAKITSSLFVQDQRPWINVRLEATDDLPLWTQEGGFTLVVRVQVENIGKTPAFDVGNGTDLWFQYKGFQERFDSLRRFAEAQSLSKGKTLFPGEKSDYLAKLPISRSNIIYTNTCEGIPMCFIIVSYRYRSGLVDGLLETTRMYKFGLGVVEGSLPETITQAGNRKVVLHLWKEMVS